MRGKKITSLEQLIDAALERRSVVCDKVYVRPYYPAAFMINLPGKVLHHLFQFGMYTYKRKKERKS